MTSRKMGLFLLPERFKQVIAGYIALVFRRGTVTSRIASDIGEIASFHLFIRERFSESRFFLTREALARHCLTEYAPIRLYEFGVASGEFCRFLLRKGSKDLIYFGFDTFSGLPSDWERGGITYLPKGAFNQNGKLPKIKNSRVNFIKGLTEDNLSELEVLMNETSNRMFILDMDLLKPTQILFDFIYPKLLPGDIIFFDQAFDSHNERKIIIESVLTNPALMLVGVSGIAAAFLVS